MPFCDSLYCSYLFITVVVSFLLRSQCFRIRLVWCRSCNFAIRRFRATSYRSCLCIVSVNQLFFASTSFYMVCSWCFLSWVKYLLCCRLNRSVYFFCFWYIVFRSSCVPIDLLVSFFGYINLYLTKNRSSIVCVFVFVSYDFLFVSSVQLFVSLCCESFR